MTHSVQLQGKGMIHALLMFLWLLFLLWRVVSHFPGGLLQMRERNSKYSLRRDKWYIHDKRLFFIG